MNEDIIANITPVNADAASHAAEAASTASTTRTETRVRCPMTR